MTEPTLETPAEPKHVIDKRTVTCTCGRVFTHPLGKRAAIVNALEHARWANSTARVKRREWEKARDRAIQKALRQLKNRHPEEFDKLYRKEMRAAGISVPPHKLRSRLAYVRHLTVVDEPDMMLAEPVALPPAPEGYVPPPPMLLPEPSVVTDDPDPLAKPKRGA